MPEETSRDIADDVLNGEVLGKWVSLTYWPSKTLRSRFILRSFTPKNKRHANRLYFTILPINQIVNQDWCWWNSWSRLSLEDNRERIPFTRSQNTLLEDRRREPKHGNKLFLCMAVKPLENTSTRQRYINSLEELFYMTPQVGRIKRSDIDENPPYIYWQNTRTDSYRHTHTFIWRIYSIIYIYGSYIYRHIWRVWHCIQFSQDGDESVERGVDIIGTPSYSGYENLLRFLINHGNLEQFHHQSTADERQKETKVC